MTARTVFQSLSRIFPRSLTKFLRSATTAFIAPNIIAHRSGHWRSSFKSLAVDGSGKPIPWYTYPSLDYLRRQSFAGRRVLEVGGGQSTLWWASRADSVVTIETDKAWAEQLTGIVPKNVEVIYMDTTTDPRSVFVAAVKARLERDRPQPFDIIVIDGAYRSSFVQLARELLSPDGAIICDNSMGYGFFEAMRESEFSRVDFYGIAPGTSAYDATSIYFKSGSFLFNNSHPIGATETV